MVVKRLKNSRSKWSFSHIFVYLLTFFNKMAPKKITNIVEYNEVIVTAI
jgi:hypothetical protein